MVEGEVEEVMTDSDSRAAVRVRIKVAVWPDGKWVAYGDDGQRMEETLESGLNLFARYQ